MQLRRAMNALLTRVRSTLCSACSVSLTAQLDRQRVEIDGLRRRMEVMQLAFNKKAEATLKRPETWSPAKWDSVPTSAAKLLAPSGAGVPTSSAQDRPP